VAEAVPKAGFGTYYDSGERRLRFVDEAVALWNYRHLVVELAARDIKVRYKRSVLGVAWTMLSPLLTMVALTIAFSAILKQQIWNYPVYLLSGQLLWTFFAQCTTHVGSLTVDASEITKRMYVPRSAFVASALLVALVNLGFALVPLLLIILATGYPIYPTWLFLPVAVAVATVFAAGVGLLVFTLASRFVDVRETYLVLLSTWFFVTPIVYSPAIVPAKYAIFLKLNPMTYLVTLFRRPLYEGKLPDGKTFVIGFLAALATLVAGWLFYSAKNEEYGQRF
jgi:ABC-type polysaccharide/polyol phosphate export permease